MNNKYKDFLKKILLNHNFDLCILDYDWIKEEEDLFSCIVNDQEFVFTIQEVEVRTNFVDKEKITISELRIFEKNKIIFCIEGLKCYEIFEEEYLSKHGLFFNNVDKVRLFFWMEEILI